LLQFARPRSIRQLDPRLHQRAEDLRRQQLVSQQLLTFSAIQFCHGDPVSM
jgi:hypothetical protein